MAIKISQLSEDTSPTIDDNIQTIDAIATTPVNKRATIKNIFKAISGLTAYVYSSFIDTDKIPIVDITTPEAKYFTVADLRKYSKHRISLIIPCSTETDNLTVGTSKITFRMPFAMTLTDIRANVNTAPTGANLIADVNASGSTIMTTNKLLIVTSEKTTTTASTLPTLTTTSLADDEEITVDVDQIGSTVAGKGLKVTLIGYRT